MKISFTVIILYALTENNIARKDEKSWPVELIQSFLSNFTTPKEIHVLFDATDLTEERQLCKSLFKSDLNSQYVKTIKTYDSVNMSNYMPGRRVAMIVLSTSKKSIETVKTVRRNPMIFFQLFIVFL